MTPPLPDAVLAVIYHDDKVLLGQRSKNESHAAGYWAAIGGGVEPGESFEQAIIREVKEEIGVDVRVVQKLESFPATENTCMLHWFHVEIISGTPRICDEEHDELRWFKPSELQVLKPSFKEDIDLLLGFCDSKKKT